jgi:Flp pilus assembly protein TadD
MIDAIETSGTDVEILSTSADLSMKRTARQSVGFGPLGYGRISRMGSKIGIPIVALLILSSATVSRAAAMTMNEKMCDVAADVALKAGDYPRAIELHSKLLRSGRNNALAHYHLGFAYGMVGRTSEEIEEYRTAMSLGLKTWDLFLNLGLAYYDQHELANATAAFETAVSLGPEHAETHFNLAVVYERENRLDEALKEIVASLVLAPEDLDAANTDAIICAKMGNLVFARNIWTQLIEAAPDYAPARTNLAMLNRSRAEDCGSYPYSCETEVLSSFGIK